MFKVLKKNITLHFGFLNAKVLPILFILLFFSQANAQVSGIKTVVIDAGHGGKDPGCSGENSKEKYIALGIALKLGKMIKQKHSDVKVIYTRTTDKFLELDERSKIANKNKADLFICIHANANDNSKAYGAETYVLGLHRTESQKKVAERENSVIYMEGEDKISKYKKLGPDAIIAQTMQLSSYLNQSIVFASKIQKEFATLGRKNRGVKQAGFYVLYHTTMPAVLIESGFLTNATDEKFLLKDTNQYKMAKAIYNAFKSYKTERDKVDKTVTNNSDKGDSSTANTSSNSTSPKNGVKFRVQIASASKKIETASYNFKGLKEISVKQDGKLYRYYYGNFSTISEAKEGKELVKTKGYNDAFLVAYQDGKRIPIQKAIELTK